LISVCVPDDQYVTVTGLLDEPAAADDDDEPRAVAAAAASVHTRAIPT
jgi:hypothetical protein